MEGVVMVTGSEGFVGKHLVGELDSLGYDVIPVDLKLGSDVRNLRWLVDCMAIYNPSIVVHLAAVSLVSEAVGNPANAMETNIIGTCNVLEAARNCESVKRIVIASSDKAYGSLMRLPYRENFRMNGKHPYDVSKSCADLIAQAYEHTYKMPIAITRCGNIYGPGDTHLTRIVPSAIRTAITDGRLYIRSNGKHIRDYVYIDDVVDAYMRLIKSNNSGAFNFGGDPVSVIELVNIISGILKKEPDYEILDIADNEIETQVLDSTKANTVLGWRKKTSLEGGLRKTIRWWRKTYGTR